MRLEKADRRTVRVGVAFVFGFAQLASTDSGSAAAAGKGGQKKS
jgi:hypothetical protein